MRYDAEHKQKTRERVLKEAAKAIRAEGPHRVAVAGVMAKAGLTHGGFYMHFPSKEALAAAVSQTLLEKAASRWDTISRSGDREDALRRIVLPYLDPTHVASAQGCPLTTIGPDVARRSTSRAAIGDALCGMIDALARVLPNRKRAKALAALSTMVGAVVLSRLADDPDLAQAFLQAAADSILPGKRPVPAGESAAGH